MMRIRDFPQVRSDSPLGSRADEVRKVGIAERVEGSADRQVGGPSLVERFRRVGSE